MAALFSASPIERWLSPKLLGGKNRRDSEKDQRKSKSHRDAEKKRGRSKHWVEGLSRVSLGISATTARTVIGTSGPQSVMSVVAV